MSYLELLRSWPTSPQLRLSELVCRVLCRRDHCRCCRPCQAVSLGAAFAARAALDAKALAVSLRRAALELRRAGGQSARVAAAVVAGGGDTG